jgi:hypothetical protein
MLTHGNPLGFSAMISRLNISDESFTAVCTGKDGKPDLIGQVRHSRGKRSAHLTFIYSGDDSSTLVASEMLDELAMRAGEMEAINLLAECKESDPAFEELRHNAFSIYGWETVWKFPANMASAEPQDYLWERMTAVDEPAVRTLYQTLVPPLVQTTEPYSGAEVHRLISRNNGELVAYVESDSGPNGIYLKPIVHPAAPTPHELVLELARIFQGLGRPVYLQMRSYQAWLTPFLEEIQATSTEHTALLVRHLTVPLLARSAATRRLPYSQQQTETSAGITQKFVQPPK